MLFHRFSTRLRRGALILAPLLALAAASPLSAAGAQRRAPAVKTMPAQHPGAPITDEAERIYQDYGNAIYQVQVIDKASDKKTVIGSGFQFNAQGMIATNYHVVSEAIRHPEGNRLEYLHDTDTKGGGPENRGSLKILIADVVHDLAILQMDKPGKSWVELGSSHLPKGTKIFSLGNPHDIGFTIIEGTYNGLTPDSFFDHIHFSGSLNPGMSGGPALGHDGRVVGINVSTAGNQISFLVPVEPLRRLLLTYIDKGKDYDFIGHANAEIESQLLDSQQKNISRILKSKWESKPFGPFMVPGRIFNAFKCWGGSDTEDKKLVKSYSLTCLSQDQLFLNENFDTGAFLYRYDSIVAKKGLHPLRFYSYYTGQYSMPVNGYSNAGEGDVTNFECNDSFVDLAGARWKASFCVRQYKKYPKLYDMHLYMAQVDADRQGMMVSAVAQGVSRANALKLAGRFMTEIKPREKTALPPPAARDAGGAAENAPHPAPEKTAPGDAPPDTSADAVKDVPPATPEEKKGGQK
ncbi:MAG: serine protease [Alphaproteobacteria bacterium]|nr:serine protease [Alphaproteobacteria bacterium]